MGCNCKGGNTQPAMTRENKIQGSSYCQQLIKTQYNTLINITSSGEILLNNSKLPSHSFLSSLGCKGPIAEKVLSLELTLTALCQDKEKRIKFFQKLGPNPTIGSLEVLIKSLD